MPADVESKPEEHAPPPAALPDELVQAWQGFQGALIEAGWRPPGGRPPLPAGWWWRLGLAAVLAAMLAGLLLQLGARREQQLTSWLRWAPVIDGNLRAALTGLNEVRVRAEREADLSMTVIDGRLRASSIQADAALAGQAHTALIEELAAAARRLVAERLAARITETRQQIAQVTAERLALGAGLRSRLEALLAASELPLGERLTRQALALALARSTDLRLLLHPWPETDARLWLQRSAEDWREALGQAPATVASLLAAAEGDAALLQIVQQAAQSQHELVSLQRRLTVLEAGEGWPLPDPILVSDEEAQLVIGLRRPWGPALALAGVLLWLGVWWALRGSGRRQ